MKYYVIDRWETEGIVERSDLVLGEDQSWPHVHAREYTAVGRYIYRLGSQAFATRAEAVEAVRKKAAQRIKAYEKRIARIKALLESL